VWLVHRGSERCEGKGDYHGDYGDGRVLQFYLWTVYQLIPMIASVRRLFSLANGPSLRLGDLDAVA
jgi:hypothetical protein